MALTVIPARSRRISQEQLETLIALSNALEIAKKQIRILESEVLEELLHGAEVEPGVHIARLKGDASGVSRLEIR